MPKMKTLKSTTVSLNDFFIAYICIWYNFESLFIILNFLYNQDYLILDVNSHLI